MEKEASRWNREVILPSAETDTEGRLRSSLWFRHVLSCEDSTGVKLRSCRKNEAGKLSCSVVVLHGEVAVWQVQLIPGDF